jgi:hypothetical protein
MPVLKIFKLFHYLTSRFLIDLFSVTCCGILYVTVDNCVSYCNTVDMLWYIIRDC